VIQADPSDRLDPELGTGLLEQSPAIGGNRGAVR